MTIQADHAHVNSEHIATVREKPADLQPVPDTVDVAAAQAVFLENAGPDAGNAVGSLARMDDGSRASVIQRMQQTHGNQFVDRLLQTGVAVQRVPAETANLTSLRQLLRDDQENPAITLMGRLAPNEVRDVLASREFKELAISAFNNSEMYRGVKAMHGDLYPSLERMFDEGTDWEKLRDVIRNAPSGHDRVRADNWMKDQFVSACNNREMAEAVNLLGGTLVQKLSWMLAEGTDMQLVSRAIQTAPPGELPLVTANQPIMNGLRSELSRGDFEIVQNMLTQGLLVGEQVEQAAREQHFERANATAPWEFTTFNWTTAYDIRYTRTELHITVRIRLTGEATTEAQRTAWAAGIQNRWNGHFHIEDSRRLGIVFEPIFTTTNPHHDVEIHPGSGRADSANWFLTTNGDIAAHEFGHLVGLEDEYHLTDADYRRLVSSTLPAGTRPAEGWTETGLMTSGVAPVQGRHLRPFVAWLNNHRLAGERPYRLVPGA